MYIFAVLWNRNATFCLSGTGKSLFKNVRLSFWTGGFLKCVFGIGLQMASVQLVSPKKLHLHPVISLKTSVADPWHFDVDPDPRIHASD